MMRKTRFPFPREKPSRVYLRANSSVCATATTTVPRGRSRTADLTSKTTEPPESGSWASAERTTRGPRGVSAPIGDDGTPIRSRMLSPLSQTVISMANVRPAIASVNNATESTGQIFRQTMAATAGTSSAADRPNRRITLRHGRYGVSMKTPLRADDRCPPPPPKPERGNLRGGKPERPQPVPPADAWAPPPPPRHRYPPPTG